MPEARDRMSRLEDVLSTYWTRRRTSGGVNRNSEVLILSEEAEDQATETPFRWRGASMVGTPRPMGVARRRGGLGGPRFGRSPAFGRSSSPVIGGENIPPVGSARGRGGLRGRGSIILPAWYPRKPLRDITAVVRAIERRRARREEGEGLETESPILQDDPSVSTSVAQLEQESVTSPHPTVGVGRCPPTIGKVPKILLNITNQTEGDSTCITPQKKLLNNIETVERVVMEELHNLKRTPAAKKAERQKRVKTLMSLR